MNSKEQVIPNQVHLLPKNAEILGNLQSYLVTKYSNSISKQLNSLDAKQLLNYHNLSIEEILDSEDILNAKKWLYPVHREDIIKIFEYKERYGIDTVICEEGIGSGKTVKNMVLIFLQLFKLITLPNPQEFYGLAPGTTMAFVLMSRNEKQARKVTFQKLLPLFNNKFFNTYFRPSADYTEMENRLIFPTELRFPKNILVFPGTGSSASTLGYDIFGASIDEANYLEYTVESKKAYGKGSYDAAEEMNFEIYNRMFSRYAEKGGRIPGILSMFSNVKYKDTFLEKTINSANVEAIDNSQQRFVDIKNKMLIFKRTTWQAKQGIPGLYSGETFKFDFQTLKIIE